MKTIKDYQAMRDEWRKDRTRDAIREMNLDDKRLGELQKGGKK